MKHFILLFAIILCIFSDCCVNAYNEEQFLPKDNYSEGGAVKVSEDEVNKIIQKHIPERKKPQAQTVKPNPNDPYIRDENGDRNSQNEYEHASAQAAEEQAILDRKSQKAAARNMTEMDRIWAVQMYGELVPHEGPLSGGNTFGEPAPTKLTGLNIHEINTSNPKWAYQQLKDLTYMQARMVQGEANASSNMRRIFDERRGVEMMDPKEANERAKTLGYNIKFSKPVSLKTFEESIQRQTEKQMLDRAYAEAAAAYRQPSSWVENTVRNVALFGAGAAGSASFSELAVSVASGLAIGAIIRATIWELKTIKRDLFYEKG